jgi:hypothetical protein
MMGKRLKPSALLCALVSELGEPPVQSVVDSCSDCGKAVWRALSSPKSPPALCRTCGLMKVQMMGARKRVVIGPLTKRQRKELRSLGYKYDG